jgi:diaminopropionate ammonia-lyase
MAGAIAAFMADYYGEDCPVITIVEPTKADCIFRTAEANDGKLHFVTDKMDSIMAGLCCGEPCTIAWEIMESYAKHFVSMPDYVTAKGMRVLGNPLPGDEPIVSGESGASCFGLVVEVLQDKELAWLKEQLGLNSESKILCISTEGDTDKANYRSIVWDGAYHK